MLFSEHDLNNLVMDSQKLYLPMYDLNNKIYEEGRGVDI